MYILYLVWGFWWLYLFYSAFPSSMFALISVCGAARHARGPRVDRARRLREANIGSSGSLPLRTPLARSSMPVSEKAAAERALLRVCACSVMRVLSTNCDLRRRRRTPVANGREISSGSTLLIASFRSRCECQPWQGCTLRMIIHLYRVIRILGPTCSVCSIRSCGKDPGGACQ